MTISSFVSIKTFNQGVFNMKKLIVVFGLTLMGAQFVNGQELGIRFGDVTGGQVAVDALFSTTDFSMVHADVSFGNGGVGVDALWDFIYRPLGDVPMNWYLGVGPSVFLGNNDVTLAGSGEVGLSYTIPGAPVSVSVDWRPAFVLIETTGFYSDRFGINLRYVFK
jgi:hypothetical protein